MYDNNASGLGMEWGRNGAIKSKDFKLNWY